MPITNGYTDLATFKLEVFPAVAQSDTQDDTLIALVIEAVSRKIDDYTGRQFFKSAGQTRYYTAQYWDALKVDDLLAVTSLKTDLAGDRSYPLTWSSTQYDLWPYNAPLGSQPRPYTEIRWTPYTPYQFPVGLPKGVQVVGDWGFSQTSPMRIQEACLLQSARLYKRKDAIFGVMGSAEMGIVSVLVKLDADVKLMLAGFERNLISEGGVDRMRF